MPKFGWTALIGQKRAASGLTYGLVIGLISIVAIGTVRTVGDNVTKLFGVVAVDMTAGTAQGAFGMVGFTGAGTVASPWFWQDGSFALSCKGYLDVTDNSSATANDASRQGRTSGAGSDGIYRIDPDGASGQPPFDVYCDMATDGGGWTMFYETDETYSWWATYGFNAFDDMDDAAWEDLEDAELEPIPQPGGANASFDPADKGINFTEVAGNWSFSATGGTTPNCRADGFHKASATTLTGDKRLQNLSGANTYLWDDKSDTTQTEWCVENSNESDGIGVNSQWCVPYTSNNANGSALYWPNPGDDLPNCNYRLQLFVR